MGTDLVTVRQNTYDVWADGQDRAPRGNRRGELVVCDFWQQLIADGRMFHMQMGVESVPINCTVAADDEMVFALIDGAVGTTYIPALYEIAYDINTDAKDIEAYLEIDRAKIRYVSGGTAYAPENLRTDRPRASAVASAYVGADVTAAAKTAVPGSIEIGHHKFTEDNVATPTGGEHHFYVLNGRKRPLGVVVGVGSVLCHFASSTSENDVTGFGCLEWAELPTEDVT